MGPGVPYAIAAKFAHPDRPVFALVGDGAMQMNGINELITIAKYWREWSDPRLVVLVLNNRDLNQVTWEQRAMEGDPKLRGIAGPADFPYAALRRADRAAGIRVDDPEQIADAWQQALSADRPVVLEAVTDPDVPPLPPHITLEQAKAMMSALGTGRPRASHRWSSADVEGQARRLRSGAVTGARSHSSPVDAPIERLTRHALTFPTDAPEPDGTISWDSTTIVLVDVRHDGIVGVGYTYGDPRDGCGDSIETGRGWSADLDAMAVSRHRGRSLRTPCGTSGGRASARMRSRGRHRPLGSQGATAGDCRWPRCSAPSRKRVPVYGSGGFTSYSNDRLADQLSDLVCLGLRRREDEDRRRRCG